MTELVSQVIVTQKLSVTETNSLHRRKFMSQKQVSFRLKMSVREQKFYRKQVSITETSFCQSFCLRNTLPSQIKKFLSEKKFSATDKSFFREKSFCQRSKLMGTLFLKTFLMAFLNHYVLNTLCSKIKQFLSLF